LTPKSYYQARHVEGTIEDPPENEDGLDYKQMEAELTVEEAIQHAMVVPEVEKRTNRIDLE
jgi:hypothetical protein